MDNFREVSKGIKGKLICVFVDSHKEDNGRILEFFNIKKEDGDQTRIIYVSVCFVGFSVTIEIDAKVWTGYTLYSSRKF